eukprot:9481462-Pyramimonas_sp.AAC.3
MLKIIGVGASPETLTTWPQMLGLDWNSWFYFCAPMPSVSDFCGDIEEALRRNGLPQANI